ncbi:MAG: PAS domain S-box protein [Leptospiraceae bacterium]|nr:PAS domain S-box protein [Leptospiraceae bacterium]
MNSVEESIPRAAPLLILVLDAKGKLEYINPFGERLTGYSLAELQGLDFFDVFVSESDRQEARQTMERLRQPDQRERKLGPIILKDGSVRLLEWIGYPLEGRRFLALGYDLSSSLTGAFELREVLDEMPVNIVILDRDARIVEINQFPLTGVNLSRESVIGRSFLDQPWFTEEKEKQKFADLFREVLQGHIARNVFRLRFHNEWRWVQGVFAPIHQDGEIHSVVGFGSDITELREAQESTREAIQLLKTVAAGAPIIIASLDSSGRFIICEGMGWQELSSEEMVGRDARDFLSHVPGWNNAIGSAFSGIKSTLEGRLGSRDFEVTFLPAPDSGGITLVGFEITQRKDSQKRIQQMNQELETRILVRTEALQESEERFRQIAEHVRDVFFLASPDLSRAYYLSPAFEELWGESAQAFVDSGRSPLDRVHPQDQKALLEIIEQNRPGQTVDREFRLLRRDGQERWVRLRTFPLPGPGEARVAGVAEDITDAFRSRMELIASREKANRANRAKSEFTARMSHELRTPLNAILGFVQVLSQKAGQEYQGDLREIREAGNHLVSLIDDLLDISRVETDQLQVKTESLPLQLLVEQACRYLANRVRKKQQNLTRDVSAELWVKGDRTRIVQILINLLSNASKYSAVGDRITVRAYTAGERVRIHVADTGPGIAEAKQPRLFSPFERLGESSSEGVGLGLYLSRELAIRMNGSMGLTSREGHGSDFWLELPLGLAMPRPGEGLSKAKKYQRSINVLYIEDNPVNLRVIGSMMETMENVRFRGVDNPEAGLFAAQQEAPDVILVDMNLGDSTGYDVMESVRKISTLRAVPLVAVSADAMHDNVQAALDAGFAAYVKKPVEMDELMGCLYRLTV